MSGCICVWVQDLLLWLLAEQSSHSHRQLPAAGSPGLPWELPVARCLFKASVVNFLMLKLEAKL